MFIKKKALLPLFLFLICLIIVRGSSQPSNIKLIHGTDFITEVPTGAKLAFQTKHALLIEVMNGTLNGTNCTLDVWPLRGSYSFEAQNACILDFTAPNAGAYDLDVSGASLQKVSVLHWRSSVLNGSSVTITWAWRLQDIISEYTMIGIGLGGIVLMSASPTWIALKMRKEGVTDDSIERLGYGMLLFFIGFGLMVMWLWS